MNYKAKAEQLVEKMRRDNTMPLEHAKQCAKICVREIIDALRITTGHCTLRSLDRQEVQSDYDYWERVSKAVATIEISE